MKSMEMKNDKFTIDMISASIRSSKGMLESKIKKACDALKKEIRAYKKFVADHHRTGAYLYKIQTMTDIIQRRNDDLFLMRGALKIHELIPEISKIMNMEQK